MIAFLYEVALVEILAIEPRVGPPTGGTDVVITGRGFAAGATVEFDGVPATSVMVDTDGKIRCTTPAHANGAVDVVITNTDTSTGTAAGWFTYESVAPATDLRYRTPGGTVSTRTRLANTVPTIHQSLGQPSVFNFTAAVEPAGEAGIEFRCFGQQLFLGTVTKTTERTDGAARVQAWDVEATDMSHRLARRRPTGSWAHVSGTTVLGALMAAFAPDFTPVIEADLGPVTIELDGTADLAATVTDVCDRCGAKWFLIGTTMHVFTQDSGIDPPADVTDSNPDLISPDTGAAVTIEIDYMQIRNRIKVTGAEGIFAVVEDAASIAQFGVSEYPIHDDALTTVPELMARGQAMLAASAFPVPVIHYSTRDLKTNVGKTVTVGVSRPAIAGDFIIDNVDIDQLELTATGHKPRFTVSAKPYTALMGSRDSAAQVVALLEDVVDIAATVGKSPKLSGDVVSASGGRTTIPAGSIPASKLAGCLPGSLLLDHTIGATQLDTTGVTPDTYGDDAHLSTLTIGPDGRVTAAATDPVPIVKTDGSQPWTANQPMGGHTFTGLPDPTTAQQPATKAYVDGLIAGVGSALTAGDGIDISSDVVSVRLDGTSLEVGPSGLKVAPPPAIGASVYRSTNQSATVNAPALILFNAETYDPDGSHVGGDPSKLTVQADGKYAVVAQFTSDTLSGAGFLQLQIAVNATIVADNSNGQGGLTVQCAVQLDLTAGDYVEAVAIINESGGTVRDILPGAGATFLQMLLIEPGATGGGGGGTSMVLGEVPTGAIDGSNRFYTTAGAFNALEVFLNGLRLQEAIDYETLSSTTFSLFEIPIVGDTLVIDYEAA